jgi:hypothetical protein
MRLFSSISFSKFFFTFLFCCIFSFGKSQSPFHFDNLGGNVRAGIIVRNDFLPNNTFKTYGLRVEYPLDEHWFMNYDYHFIATSSGIHFSHVPFFAMGIKYIPRFATTDLKALGSLMVLMMVIPEGVSYKINPQDKIQFVPYLNPLGFNRLVFEREGQTIKKPWAFAINTGLEVQSDLPWNMYAAADTGVTLDVFNGKSIWGVGITIGMKLQEY